LLVSLGAVLMAVLNCHDVFVVPALAPLLFSVNVIAAILLFYRHWGLLAAGVGILAGGIGGVVGQLPLFFRRGYDLRPDWHWSDPRVRRIVRQWVPVVASASIFAITQQVALILASGLEDGSTSALANALVFWQLPFGILSVSVVTAHFPRMSRHAAAGDMAALRDAFAGALRLIVALMLPPAVFYLFFGEAVIQVALERLTFAASGTRLASQVLAGYAVGLLSVAVFNFVQRYFYAISDYRTPFLAAVAVAAIDIPLAIILKETGLRVAGLAVANSIAFSAGAVLLLAAARKRLQRLAGERPANFAARVLTANVALALLLAGVAAVTGAWWQPGSTWRNAALIASIGAIAIAATLALYRILRLAWWQPAGP
jgi:putative peptidoglycan lipid II flippase